MHEYIISLPCCSNWISSQITYVHTPIHCSSVCICEQQPESFHSSVIQQQNRSRRKCTPNCLILARTSNCILWKHWGVPLFLNEEKIWSQDTILLRLLWFTNWPTLISLWNCFLSAKWTELTAAFLLIQSNAWNINWGLAANLSSQHFSLTCTYLRVLLGFLFTH